MGILNKDNKNVTTGNNRKRGKSASILTRAAAEYARNRASGDVRTNDRSLSPVARKASDARIEASSTRFGIDNDEGINNESVGASESANEYSGSGGETTGRGNRGRGNSGSGTDNRTAADTGSGTREETSPTMGVSPKVERPPIIRQRKQRADKGVKRSGKSIGVSGSDVEKHAVLGVISITVETIFRTIALKQGEHWKVNQQENLILSQALQEALETLPGDSYLEILGYIEKFGPWVAVAWTAYNICSPRIARTKQINATKAKTVNAGSENNLRQFRNNRGEHYTTTAATDNQTDSGIGNQQVV